MSDKLSTILSNIKTEASNFFAKASVARWFCPNDANSAMDMESLCTLEFLIVSWGYLVNDFQRLENFLSRDSKYIQYKQDKKISRGA